MRCLLIAAGLCLRVCLAQAQHATEKITVSGYVREMGSREALIGVSIRVTASDGTKPATTFGTTTNTYGFYSITLPAAGAPAAGNDSTTLVFSFVGYETISRRVALRPPGARRPVQLDVELAPGQVLDEVRVSAKAQTGRVSDNAQMSQIELPVAQLKKVPTLLGEKDVLRVLQLMPGVQKGTEGQTGLYVRGGGPDQNLLILDDAVVYNASHLFGFFSVFNGDALKSVELTKGGFPARYGGRLSSVLELNLKDGNRERFRGEGGIGLIASRLTLEGPLSKRKNASFIISARRTYLDALSKPLLERYNDGLSTGGYYFYDLNAKINVDLGRRDKLYLSGYFGRDVFSRRNRYDSTYATRLGLNWGNATATLRWNHQFSPRLFANTSLIFSNYRFLITNDEEGAGRFYTLRYRSGIRDVSIKHDIDFYPNPRHSLRFGLLTTFHRFTPSAIVVRNTNINHYRDDVDAIDVVESAVYAEDTWRPSDRWRLQGGLRLSHLRHRHVAYLRPEPRLSVAYVLRPDLSVKASYALMNQYVHLLSNTGIGLPTDLWVPTTDRVRPQLGQQWALGLAKDIADRGLTLTLEGYYKTMNHIISYREGASFLVLDAPDRASQIDWQDNVVAGRGWSYGAELLVQKKMGRFSGWAGYTLSWTYWQFPQLNGGRLFHPRYDRRHDVSLVGIFELNKRVTLSATWVYGTGNALTIPTARYAAYRHAGAFAASQATGQLIQLPFDTGTDANVYPGKNTFRAEPYHRLDVGAQFHKKKGRFERTWEVSLYNTYNRRNPFFYNLESKPVEGRNTRQTVLYRYSIFPIVPSVTYNFSF